MRNYKIDEQSLTSLLNYLATKPYKEVVGAIETLRNLEVINGDDKLQSEASSNETK